MILFLTLLIASETVALGYLGWILLRKSPGKPRETPISVPVVSPEPAAPAHVPLFVRQLDYEADLAALTRRIVDLETAGDQRHQQITGLIGNLQQQLKRGERGEKTAVLAEAMGAAMEARRAPVVAAPTAAPSGLPVVRIRRGG